MKRLTKKIDLQEFGSAYIISSAFISEIPNKFLDKDYVGEAPNKLGQLEDTFELIEEMYKKPVGWKNDIGEEYYDYYTHSTILYNPKTNEIEIYEYEFIASYKIEEYGITWWLKEDKSE